MFCNNIEAVTIYYIAIILSVTHISRRNYIIPLDYSALQQRPSKNRGRVAGNYGTIPWVPGKARRFLLVEGQAGDLVNGGLCDLSGAHRNSQDLAFVESAERKIWFRYVSIYIINKQHIHLCLKGTCV